MNYQRIRKYIFRMAVLFLPFCLHAQHIPYPGSEMPHVQSFRNLADTNELLKIFSADTKWQKERADSAIDIFRDVLRQSRGSGYIHGIAQSLVRLGFLYAGKGMYPQSLRAYKEALKYSLSGNASHTAIIYSGIGNVHLAQGAFEQAAAYYHRAAQIAEENNLTEIAGSVYNNLAGVFSKMKQYDKALHYLDKAEQIARRHGNNSLLARTVANRGTVYMYLQDWEKSLFYFETLLATSREYGWGEMQHIALTYLGAIFMGKDMPQRALPYLIRAQTIKDPVNPVNHVFSQLILGKAYYRTGDYKNAGRVLAGAAEQAKQMGLEDETAEAHKTLAQLYASAGRYKESLHQRELYDQLKDKMENLKIVQNINQLETRFRTAQKDKDIIRKQLHINQQERHLERKNMLIAGSVAGITILTVLLASLYRSSRHKQRLHINQIKLLQQEQQLRQREQEMAELKALIQGEEKERSRIARELHDGIVSSLSAIRLNFSTLLHRMQSTPYAADFEDTLQQLSEATQELRFTAQNLTPEILLQNGLTEAIQSFCEKIEKAAGIDTEFLVYGNIPPMDTSFELSLYRMTQELVHNVIKHAQASQLTVQFSCMQERLGITIEDNGIGIGELAASARKGTGLANIRARVKTMDGHMNITDDHTGTTVYLEFDLHYVKKTDTLC